MSDKMADPIAGLAAIADCDYDRPFVSLRALLPALYDLRTSKNGAARDVPITLRWRDGGESVVVLRAIVFWHEKTPGRLVAPHRRRLDIRQTDCFSCHWYVPKEGASLEKPDCGACRHSDGCWRCDALCNLEAAIAFIESAN